MFEELFIRKRAIPTQLLAYGFHHTGESFQYTTDIINGRFRLAIQIAANGNIDTHLVDAKNNTPYILYKTDAAGKYIGEIRKAVTNILADIAAKCYEPAVFKSAQAQMVIEFVRNTYGDEPEFLWQQFPDNAVWRRKDNLKWYGALLTVQGHKLGLNTPDIVEIIDLRMNITQAELILANPHYYPGWHMNKKHWFTVVLDGTITDKELQKRICQSYQLAVG